MKSNQSSGTVTSSINDSPDLVVCVESCKGGVGKTTAALCLGNVLRRQGYKVLLMDLDITGTNAADVGASRYWNLDVNILKEPSKDLDNSPPLNFVKLFDRCFMAGKQVPQFTLSGTDQDRIKIEPQRINVLGSQLFVGDEDLGGDVGRDGEKHPLHVRTPAIFFDDIHTYWLLDLVKTLVKDFVRVRGEECPTETAIILDMSPGYVGVVPRIHDWLTDCGPTKGKFLVVSSLDEQDLKACRRSIIVLHDKYVGKWKASLGYHAAISQQTQFPSLSEAEDTFFVRLATAASEESGQRNEFEFYIPAEGTPSADIAKVGKEFADNPRKYIGFLINRVPRGVKAGLLDYDFGEVFGAERGINEILGYAATTPGHDWKEMAVSNDEYLENQFLERHLRSRSADRKPQLKKLRTTLTRELNKLAAAQGMPKTFALGAKGNEEILINEFDAAVTLASDSISRVIVCLENTGFFHLARLVHEEWLPGSVVPDFRRSLLQLFENDLYSGPNGGVSGASGSHGTKPYSTSSNDYFNEVIIEAFSARDFYRLSVSEFEVAQLSGSICWIFGQSLPKNSSVPLDEAYLKSLMNKLLLMELKHLSLLRKKRKDQSSGLASYLGVASSQDSLISELFRSTISNDSLFSLPRFKVAERKTVEIYRKCLLCQVRIIDVIDDVLFLVDLFRFVTDQPESSERFLPYIRTIASDVIVKKTTPHANSPEEIRQALRSSNYFGEFDQVLTKLVSDWGICK